MITNRIKLNTTDYHGEELEVNITYQFETPICSVCKKDIRNCVHLPGGFMDGEEIFYRYEGGVKVIECTMTPADP